MTQIIHIILRNRTIVIILCKCCRPPRGDWFLKKAKLNTLMIFIFNWIVIQTDISQNLPCTVEPRSCIPVLTHLRSYTSYGIHNKQRISVRFRSGHSIWSLETNTSAYAVTNVQLLQAVLLTVMVSIVFCSEYLGNYGRQTLACIGKGCSKCWVYTRKLKHIQKSLKSSFLEL